MTELDTQIRSYTSGGEVLLTGIGIILPECEGLEQFERRLYLGTLEDSIQTGERLQADSIYRAVVGALKDAGLARDARLTILELGQDPFSNQLKAGSFVEEWRVSHVLTPVQNVAVGISLAHKMLVEGQTDAVLMFTGIKTGSGGGCAVLFEREAADQEYGLVQQVTSLDALAPIDYLELNQNILPGPWLQQFSTTERQIAIGNHRIVDPSGLFGLIKVAISVAHRYIPPVELSLETGNLDNQAFSLLFEALPWFDHVSGEKRYAALVDVDWSLTVCAIPDQSHRLNSALSGSDLALMPLAATSGEDLVKTLDLFVSMIDQGEAVENLVRQAFSRYNAMPTSAYVLVILGHTTQEIRRELEFAIKGIPASLEKGTDWQTPAGSYFTPYPLGKTGKVAFVYPGAFNSYTGAGRDLFHSFPQLYTWMDDLTADLAAALQSERLYPRGLHPFSKEEVAALDAELLADPVVMLTSGTVLSVCYTMVLEKVFSIRPGVAFGYSLGETSMLYATGVWKQGDATRDRLECSPLFQSRLAGPQNSIREAWGMAALDQPAMESLWANYLIMAAPQQVNEIVQQEEKVYLTHINTPRQVVIGGDPQACQRVIQQVGRTYLKAPFDFALHCSPIQSEYDDLLELYTWPVENIPDQTLYTAAGCRPLTLDRRAIASDMADMLCNTVDFPSLIRRTYQDGARLFIELGAGSNCAKWIDDSLQDQPHLAVSINRRGVDDLTSIFRVLARLCSHQAVVDLSPIVNRTGKEGI